MLIYLALLLLLLLKLYLLSPGDATAYQLLDVRLASLLADLGIFDND